ncbi:uncharacterized protein LOC121653696 isoform X2 [Melanotaenia boesemani]|uniref:uncharacterized protein LOC121653696 isoform X2 n=1 Tax=Melanotaenia boesemani TaxID=1250792 RepID=UPI001C055C9A|nr:uncharacterized protein LOC121653696 isoform X2 [Melanotaenia boesemani]
MAFKLSSDMNWDNQLSSVLLVADGSVAKMRERLTPRGKFPKEGVDLNPPAPPHWDLHHHQPSPSLSTGVQWADLAAIQSQLQIQKQAIESLTQKLHDMEKEKESQHCHIRNLQDEVHRLREELIERERGQEDLIRRQSPGVEQRMEQWRREVGRELSSLRGHITRATSLGDLEESFSSKLRREELELLRRELDQLKTQLRRQEEDMFLQQAESRETRRQYERSCKTLEELTDRYRTHSTDLIKTISQYSHTQQEVRQIRTTVSELKEEVRSLILGRHEPAPLPTVHTSGASPLPAPHSQTRGDRADSDSEDFSPTPSLAEISSDDLSWVDDGDPGLHEAQRARPRVRSTPSDSAGPGSDLEDDGDDLLDDVNSELGSDTSLNDL